ncbi:17942_t:CDS:2, partial [Funneliformis geosporum]
RVNRYKNRSKPNINPPDDNFEQSVDEPSESSKYTTEEDNISGSSTSPDYKPFQDLPDLGSTIDNRILWILLWIMTFQTRFNIMDTATEALINL